MYIKSTVLMVISYCPYCNRFGDSTYMICVINTVVLADLKQLVNQSKFSKLVSL